MKMQNKKKISSAEVHWINWIRSIKINRYESRQWKFFVDFQTGFDPTIVTVWKSVVILENVGMRDSHCIEMGWQWTIVFSNVNAFGLLKMLHFERIRLCVGQTHQKLWKWFHGRHIQVEFTSTCLMKKFCISLKFVMIRFQLNLTIKIFPLEWPSIFLNTSVRSR